MELYECLIIKTNMTDKHPEKSYFEGVKVQYVLSRFWTSGNLQTIHENYKWQNWLIPLKHFLMNLVRGLAHNYAILFYKAAGTMILLQL